MHGKLTVTVDRHRLVRHANIGSSNSCLSQTASFTTRKHAMYCDSEEGEASLKTHPPGARGSHREADCVADLEAPDTIAESALNWSPHSQA